MLGYYLTIPFVYLLSYLPFGVLYAIGDVVAVLLHRVIGYRKKLIVQHLQQAFPAKSGEEINVLVRQYYRHLGDRIAESIKCTTISRSELLRRCKVENYELVESLCRQGKNVVAVLGHSGSWEMACLSASIYIAGYKKYAVYTAASNKYFNNFLKQTRGRFGMQLISMKEMPAYLRYGFGGVAVGMYLADQGHSNPRRAYWTNFLNRETGFMTGPARFAKAHNGALIFVKVKQQKRGYYSIENVLLAEDVQNCTEQELTERFVRMLEKQIHESPSDWLWSHKRWKHPRPV